MAKRGFIQLPGDIQLIANLQDERLVLESIRKKFDAEGVEQTAGTLILQKKLPTTTAEIVDFEVMQDQGQQFDTEIRLARPDSFTITKMAFLIGYKLNATIGDLEGADLLFAGPNDAATTLGVDDVMINAFHAGHAIIKSDTVTYVDSWDLRRSRHVGVSQEGLDPGGGTGYAADSWSEDTGFARMIPSITLSGSFKNKVQVQFPRPIDLSGVDATIDLFLCIMMRGFLNQGGAEFRTANPNS